jgi:hypothetical protein
MREIIQFNSPEFSGFVEKNLFVAWVGKEIPLADSQFQVVVSASGSTSPLVKVSERRADGYGQAKTIRSELGEYSVAGEWPDEVFAALEIGRAWTLLPYTVGEAREKTAGVLRRVPSLAEAAGSALKPLLGLTDEELWNIWLNLDKEDPKKMKARMLEFVRTAVASERERCARLCDEAAYSHQNTAMLGPEQNALKCAALIRGT